MKIKLGIAPIAWSNDDMPELGGDTPIEKCLDDANASGFTGIELGGKFPRNPGIIKFLLEKFKLKMPGGWYGSLLRQRTVKEEWTALQDHLNLLKLLNADVFVFADVSGSIQGDQTKALSQRPKLEKEEWSSYFSKINELSNMLMDEGMPISYHEHMGTIIQSEEDVDRFMESTNDNTFLLYDTGHLMFAEADYQRVLKNYITRINHVHCKDIRKDIFLNSLKNDLSFRDSFLKGVFTVPGDGCIDYNPLIKILYESNYREWLIIEAEQDPKNANPLEYAKIGYNYLLEVIKNNGYSV
tara:strand:- start:391 stop:1284 length:894 start_codon:yes stop_codon:yes gene_type:complete